MHDLQDSASIVSILLKPLLVDGVGTAALRRAEEPLGGLSATSLDLFSPDSRCRPQDLEAQVAKYTCPVRTLYLFSDVLPVEAKLCMSSEIGRADRVCLGPKTGRYLPFVLMTDPL